MLHGYLSRFTPLKTLARTDGPAEMGYLRTAFKK